MNGHELKDKLVIFLMGPTCCGKSLLSMRLKEILPVELISVDSALIYRDMNIGTAKPSDFELLKYTHFLVNIKDPSEFYSVGEFYSDVIKIIKYIHSINRIPLLVGGTMFYFKVLVNGLSILPSSNNKIRTYLLMLLKKKSSSFLFNKLKFIDPISSKRIHPNDIQRILRALEVFFISGKTLTQLTKFKKKFFPYNIIKFALIPENKVVLFNNIQVRFRKMLSFGFEDEVKNLFNRRNLNKNLPSIRCIGYRQMWDYFDNILSYDEMICEVIRATKRLAKSQLTWLKSWSDLNILYSNEELPVLISKVVDVVNMSIFRNKCNING